MAGEVDPRLLLGLEGPDSRFTTPASISEGSDVVSRSPSSAYPLTVGGWSSALLSLIPHSPSGKSQPPPGFNPYLVDGKS